ncbi:uncharacterized protein LOC106084919 [Stomoxys calcitrans]|uniref:Single domain-containing protein n=1 Tax=Stomoxys calcitrans TaxID=35570 RepID=A0A1I8P6Y4_STOCA|nr:uncharacterized protein LOC106084919 [Stomoxys calcitrans]
MKFYTLIAVIFAIIGIAQAADKCTVNGKTFDQGEKYQPPGTCEIYECFGKNGMIHSNCPPIDTLKPCKYFPQDTSKPYPKCCARQKC